MVSEEYPFIIKDAKGSIVSVAYTNPKGYKKSLENGKVWVIHADTGRLLPYTGPGCHARLLSLKEGKGWYEAALNDDAEGGGETPVSKDELPAATQASQASQASQTAAPDQKRRTPKEGGIVSLAALIKERHRQMPEGSYTTYLFESGGEKIRKKTGEEAVELILATQREQIVYEAADLIYHMLVLLESEDIAWQDVLAELGCR